MRNKLLDDRLRHSICGSPIAQASSQSFSGTISDSMSGAHHMKNAIPAQCTRECVKQESDFALLSGTKVYTLKGDKAQLDYPSDTIQTN